jgi:type II secretory pathway pseudopilin PulG
VIRRRNSGFGFTIVELLVAATITAVIVVMLGTMFGSMMKTSMRATQRTDAFRDARAALQMMKRDLANLVQAQPSAYFAMTDIYAGDPNTTTAKNRQLYALCALKNHPPGAAANAIGDICAVGYYCSWDNNRYTLRRYFRDSAATFAAFKANGPGTYLGAATLYQPTSADELLATNVWNLQITPYKADGTQITPVYPLIVDQATPPPPIVTLPAAIEVSFNAMSSEAARTIRSVSTSADDWMNTASGNNQRLVAPNAYEFRTRINF